MASKKISQLTSATVAGADLVELSKLSASVTLTGTNISALASDNSYNHAGSGFVSAGFAAGDQVRVQGFTGNVVNNIFSARVTTLTAGKMTIGDTDGNVIVDDAAGESVTITKWESVRTTAQAIADLAGGGGGGGVEIKGLTYTSDTGSTADSDPGAGLFKWNNATQASATVLYFDNQTADGVSLTTFYASLGPTGYIYLQQSDDATKWQLWKWTATPVDGTGYRKFTATLQASGGSIVDNKTVYADFSSAAAGAALLTEDQTFTGANRGTVTADNDLSFDLAVTNNFSCTPTGGGTLTFTNIAAGAGQSGFIKLDNSGGHTIAAAGTTKVGSTMLADISTAGIFLLSYFCDGSNVFVVASGGLS